jgi:hypothetical protein
MSFSFPGSRLKYLCGASAIGFARAFDNAFGQHHLFFECAGGNAEILAQMRVAGWL